MADSTGVLANPFSFDRFVADADVVATSVLLILAAMSLSSWYVIFTKVWDQSRVRRSYGEVEKKFWTSGNLRDGMSALSGRDNVFRTLVEDGARASQYYEEHLAEQVSLNDWITVSLHRSVESINSRLTRGLAILATTGSVSPFVGLFGTVWGIYNALISISLTGNPSLEHIAGPIGEALIMTAVGLFVAVPAVIGYNWLLRRNKDIQESLRYFAADVHTYLVGGARVDTTAPVIRQRPTAVPKTV